MLDVIYYPISFLLRLWHDLFGAVLGADSGAAWALSVVFVVFTARAVLLWPSVVQADTARRMRRLAPQLHALRAAHADDARALARQTQRLHAENGVRPLLGCLPALVQIPVFLGVYHVLRSFNRTGTGYGQLGLSPEVNAVTPNYVFPVDEVQSFLSARLFGAPLSVSMNSSDSVLRSFADFGGVPSGSAIAAVVVVLMVIAAVATHCNARLSMRAGSFDATAGSQAVLMRRLSLWCIPVLGALAGPVLPIAILLYWVANNGWTHGQQRLMTAIMRRRDDQAASA